MTMTSRVASDHRPVAEARPPDPDPPARDRSAATVARELVRRSYRAVQGEALLVAVLVGSFIARWLIANRNSYWLDELLSVARYGIWNDSASAAVQRLADTSVHPPLYQFLLYYWMDWFGDGERATRSLSNLFITLATLFLFLLVRDAFSRRLALASAVTFALMYTPMFYALETRSYAQTLFLVTLSSYGLLRIMRAGAASGCRSALVSPSAAAFMFSNVALLLTHYYNFYFWAAQGVIAGVFVLRERHPRGWLSGLAAVAGMYAIQAGIFALSWGRVMISDYRRRAEAFSGDGEIPGPLDMLRRLVIPNIDAPTLIWWVGLALFAVVAARAVMVLARRGAPTDERQRAWTVAYLIGWLIVPLLVEYAALLITGVARDHERYWLFIMPPLAPLVVLTVDKAVRLAGRAWHWVRGTSIDAGWATIGMAVVIVTLILPGTLAAADYAKADWRGTAQEIVTIIESNPESSYVVYETSFSTTSILDYYLSRYSDEVRVAGIIRRQEEDRGGDFGFERTADLIEQHDFLIVPFIHHRTGNFPNALETLAQTYRVHYRQIDDRGHGLVIYATSGDDAPVSAGSR